MDEFNGAQCVVEGKLYWLPLRSHPQLALRSPTAARNICFSVDDVLLYEPFYADFGPLNLGKAYRFCRQLQTLLQEGERTRKRVYYFCGPQVQHKSNAAVLIGLYQLLFLGRSADEVCNALAAFKPYAPFRDASCGAPTFHLTVFHCIRGAQKARDVGFLDWGSSQSQWSNEEYEHYEQVENGDLNWIVPGKLVAFSGPAARCNEIPGYRLHTPEDYWDYFRKKGVSAIVRLNKKSYDRKRFTDGGFNHHDLYFPDGSCPREPILMQFLDIAEAEPGAVAVHCKAGLGRTGLLICCYIMKHFKFTAEEVIGYIRLCRPGSVIGPQQNFLCDVQGMMWAEGDMWRSQRGIHKPHLMLQDILVNCRGTPNSYQPQPAKAATPFLASPATMPYANGYATPVASAPPALSGAYANGGTPTPTSTFSLAAATPPTAAASTPTTPTSANSTPFSPSDQQKPQLHSAPSAPPPRGSAKPPSAGRSRPGSQAHAHAHTHANAHTSSAPRPAVITGVWSGSPSSVGAGSGGGGSILGAVERSAGTPTSPSGSASAALNNGVGSALTSSGASVGSGVVVGGAGAAAQQQQQQGSKSGGTPPSAASTAANNTNATNSSNSANSNNSSNNNSWGVTGSALGGGGSGVGCIGSVLRPQAAPPPSAADLSLSQHCQYMRKSYSGLTVQVPQGSAPSSASSTPNSSKFGPFTTPAQPSNSSRAGAAPRYSHTRSTTPQPRFSGAKQALSQPPTPTSASSFTFNDVPTSYTPTTPPSANAMRGNGSSILSGRGHNPSIPRPSPPMPAHLKRSPSADFSGARMDLRSTLHTDTLRAASRPRHQMPERSALSADVSAGFGLDGVAGNNNSTTSHFNGPTANGASAYSNGQPQPSNPIATTPKASSGSHRQLHARTLAPNGQPRKVPIPVLSQFHANMINQTTASTHKSGRLMANGTHAVSNNTRPRGSLELKSRGSGSLSGIATPDQARRASAAAHMRHGLSSK